MSASQGRSITRREFLARMGAGGAGLTAAWLVGGRVLPVYAASITPSCSQPRPGAAGWGVLIDLTRCVGCGSCALQCKEVNGLPQPYEVSRSLNSDVYSCVQTCETTTAGGDKDVLYVKRNCMHCLHPACVSACTVGALRKLPEGPVVYDADKCIGCRYCQYACPFGVPTFQWEETLGLISKCQFCFTRLNAGQGPACVEACPNGALQFDKRQALLVEAHARIAAEPGRYVNHVYGEREAGGTSVLYLSPVPFTEIGFPELGTEPIPHNAEAVMTRTPLIALTAASVLTGANWLARRREAAAEREETFVSLSRTTSSDEGEGK